MATKIEISTILGHAPDDGRTKIAKTKIICTLGPKSREVPILEKLLRAGMNVARFNFSHGSFEYQQYTLDNLRRAMHNTQLMCAVLLDTKVLLLLLLLLPLLSRFFPPCIGSRDLGDCISPSLCFADRKYALIVALGSSNFLTFSCFLLSLYLNFFIKV